MSDARKGYVRYQNRQHDVKWHPISGEVYVYTVTWKYAGKARSFESALDVAYSWLNSD